MYIDIAFELIFLHELYTLGTKDLGTIGRHASQGQRFSSKSE